jgi:tRNA threonylcarbamoyladenosine biosynthesis protein TsaB
MILSLDTSGPLFSIALLCNSDLKEKIYEGSRENSEKIIIEIELLIKDSGLSFDDIKGIAFCSGPGSFSGVRVASGIAYGIAFAKNIPIVGVSSLEALAAIHPNKNTICCIDARMKQLYVGMFESVGGILKQLNEFEVHDPHSLPFSGLEKPIIIGSAVKTYCEALKLKYGELSPKFIEEDLALAGIIARLAQDRFGDEFDLRNAKPMYIRNKVADTIVEREKNQKR